MTRRDWIAYTLLFFGMALAGYASRRKGPRLTKKGLDRAMETTAQERRELGI